jgi:Mg2+-importing ATPase
MTSMAIVSPFLPFLPLAAKQILLNNFLSDLPMLALASDTVTPDQVRSPLRLGSPQIQRFMLIFGLISSSFDLLTFGFLLWVVRSNEAVFQTSWFVMSLLTELAVTLVLRTQGPAWRSRPGGLLAWATVLVTLIAFAAPYLGEISTMFGFQPLAPQVLAALVIMTAGYVTVTEVAKLWFFRRVMAPGGRSGGAHPA